MNRRSFLRSASLAAAGMWTSRTGWSQFGPLTVSPLAANLHLLANAGGNIAILDGPEGLLLVDCGVPEAIEGVMAETRKIGNGKVTRLLNTHWHFDHAGGNPRLGKGGAKIFAHTNTKKWLSEKHTITSLNMTFEPLPAEGLPSETFTEPGKMKHGAETVSYRRLPAAHTDGDTVYHFQNANVIHTGDLFSNGVYPFIDYSTGGSLAGMVADSELLLKMANDKSQIIPGHGPLATKKDLKVYSEMLADCLEIMKKQIKQGKTLDEVQAAKPFAKYDGTWGVAFMKPEMWVAVNYTGMKG